MSGLVKYNSSVILFQDLKIGNFFVFESCFWQKVADFPGSMILNNAVNHLGTVNHISPTEPVIPYDEADWFVIPNNQ